MSSTEVVPVPVSGRVANGPHGTTTVWELVTGEVARYYKSKRHPNQRKLMPAVHKRYSRDLVGGNWETTHEGIAFDVDDYLVDGQNRLESIADTNVATWMLVTRGLTRNAISAINRGKMRTLVQTLHMQGFDMADVRVVATARMMMIGPEEGRKDDQTDSEVAKFIEEHREAIIFAQEAFPKSWGSSVVASVIARSWAHADVEDVRRFCTIVHEDLPFDQRQPRDDMPAKLRKAQFEARNSLGSAKNRTTLYRKAQNALNLYLNNKVRQTLMATMEDLFPLVKDADAK